MLLLFLSIKGQLYFMHSHFATFHYKTLIVKYIIFTIKFTTRYFCNVIIYWNLIQN